MEAKGVQAGVPQRTTSLVGKPMESVHINLAGPYEASVGVPRYLIMFIDSASRWMCPYRITHMSEATAYV